MEEESLLLLWILQDKILLYGNLDDVILSPLINFPTSE